MVRRSLSRPRSILEPEEPDRAGACMRADDRAERGGDLDLGVRTNVANELLELGHPLGRLRVGDANSEPRLIARRRAAFADAMAQESSL